MDFRNWLRCPACTDDAAVGVLAHETEIVLECYECGRTAEFTVGRDVPFQDLDSDRFGGAPTDGVTE